MPQAFSQNQNVVAGRNPYLYKSNFYSKFNGGLNVRSLGHLIRDDQLTVASDIMLDVDSGSINIRTGYDEIHPTVSPAANTLKGIYHATFVISNAIARRLVNTDGVTIYADDNLAGTWTDITGALVMSAPASNRVWFGQLNNLLIGSDGTNAPWKWAGALATPAVALGGSPPTAELGFEWNGYYFFTRNYTNANRLYYSAIGDPETWPAANFIDIPSPFDGDPIMGYGFTYGNLIIYKRRSIYIVTGKTATEWKVDKLNASYGLASVQAVINVENTSFFVTDRGLYELNGISIKHVSFWVEPRYRTAIANHSDTKPIAVGHLRRRNQIWVAVDFNNDGTYDRVFVHDYFNRDEAGQLAVTEYNFASTPIYFAEYITTSGNILMMTTNADKFVWQQDTTQTDNGTAIVAVFATKYFDLGDALALKHVRFVRTVATSTGSGHNIRTHQTSDVGMTETITSQSATYNQRVTLLNPNSSDIYREKFFAFGLRITGSGATVRFAGFQWEFAPIGRRL